MFASDVVWVRTMEELGRDSPRIPGFYANRVFDTDPSF